MLKFVPGVVILVVFAASPAVAMGGAGVPADSSDNHRPPDMSLTSPLQPSEYDTARRLIRHKQYADAIPHLQLALADKPADETILSDLTLAKRMVGDYDGSLYYGQRALAIDPGAKDVHENLGELYLTKNDMTSATKELATLTTLCPSGCDEREALAGAIAAYKPAVSSGSGAAAIAAPPNSKN